MRDLSAAKLTQDRLYVGILAACIAVAITGVAMVARGLSMPVFRADSETVQAAFMSWCNFDGQIDRAAGDRYFALFTDHYWWVDLGTGLILTAVTMALIVTFLRSKRGSGTKSWFRTPDRRWHFIALGVGVLAWGWAALMNSLRTDFLRDYFPWCADSMMIPMFELTVLTVIVAPVLVAIGWAITRLFDRLPVSLIEWDRSRPIRSWILSLGFAGVALAILGVLALSLATTSGRAAPAFMVAIYLLASTRAALLARGPLNARHRDAVIN